MRFLLAASLLAASAGAKESVVLRSGPGKTSLLELFTSEGCSSCPGADAWLGGLEGREGLWTAFVPVGFHVTYWDRLGWPDPWGMKAYTERQKGHSERWGAWRVYTPGFVFDGTENRPERLPTRPGGAAGTLTARVTGRRIEVGYAPAQGSPAPARALCAPLGMGLESRVRNGENAGRTLRHSFTALGLASAPLLCKGSSCTAELELPTPAAKAPRTALAVWVEGADGTPLQAAGGPLP